ncbi:acyl-CoA dehydrogenase [Bordetella genomosp. 12]|uniref:Acyl-CoA dehydrogenase n=1 Tax=Bordetella genomosp. 12 TaxID=463035 RepID=A0A261VBZ0_9BORD|nr:acyl-CoA dehydrogenase [Bordetella genomosp. 12]OZI71664.1 acyl-CoA dehydrogenase [Bordetella genomosp. 12]
MPDSPRLTPLPDPLTPPAALPPGFLDKLRLGASARDAERLLPYAEIAELKALRFGARRLPIALGGAGASIAEVMASLIDLAEADPNIAHIWRNHTMLLERVGIAPTRDAALLRLRARLAQGDLLSLAATELDRAQTGGSSRFSSTFRPAGDHFRFSGRKFYSTGVLYADWILVTGSREDGSNASAIVPADRAGIERLDDWTGMGQRLTATGTTLFHDVRIEPQEIISAEAIPPEAAPLSSTTAQLVLTGVVAGIVASVARDAAELLARRKRTYYFAPAEHANDDPILLQGLGERQADAFGARAIVLAAADFLDRAAAAMAAGAAPDEQQHLTQEAAAAAAKAKILVDRIAHAAATALFDVAGASSTLREKNLDRHWRNLRTVSSHNPASYKAFALGNRTLNNVPLPRLGFF